ncbi:putative aminoadipate reductase [Chiua virens]|nr:putative aminoadipate reductase [Chiua virens]
MFVYADADAPDTLTEISFLEFGRAAHRIAHALRPSRRGQDGDVVMIIANTDTILHHAVAMGLSIAGWIPFPASPRNSPAAVVSMLKKINCSHIVTLGRAHKGLIDGIHRELDGVQLIVSELPTLCYAFPKLGKEVATDPFIQYPVSVKRPELDSPAIYIHSSGSTGFPKPIAHSHRSQIQWFTRECVRKFTKYPAPRRVGAMALPPYHVYGNFVQLYVPLAYLVTSVVYAPRTAGDPLAQPVVPTSDNMIECIKRVKCNSLITVPTFLEHMTASSEAIKVLRKLDAVVYGGGPLPVKVGQQLWAAGVPLCVGYGGTEFGPIVGEADKEDITNGDWMWMRFQHEPAIRWAPLGDETYELQILMLMHFNSQRKLNKWPVENIPDVKGYATSDVFVKHPTKDMWRIIGRVDDVIILASGEKTVPAPMESIIMSSPLVQGAVMFGRERNQVGVLVEPSPGHVVDIKDEKAVIEFRNQIWATIEEANKPSPAFSRIFKEMILIASIGKPMLRAPKGTIQRKITLDAYSSEINALYDTVEASHAARDGSAEPSKWTSDALEEWLLKRACEISSDGQVDPHVDLFSQGFDSLSATYLRNRISDALRRRSTPEIKKAVTRIPYNIIFENPTIKLLSSRVAALANDARFGHHDAVDLTKQHQQSINAMIEKYSVGLRGPAVEPVVVLLTGSTGGLGCFLLAQLLQSHVVQRVIALNRPSSTKSIQERQQSAFEDRGLPIDLLDSNKLVYVESNAGSEWCGLSPAQYEEAGRTRNLLKLGLDSPQSPNLRFLFTSSIGSAQAWDNSKGRFSEEIQLDSSFAIGSGYGEAKYAAERIIAKSGLHSTSLRIGQIAGGVGGSWATTDWFPILVKSSIALGALPESAGVVSWLREEDVAAAILETAFSKKAPPPALNLVNPCGTPWAEIIAFVRRAIIKSKSLEDDVLPVIPFGDWFALLEKRAESASEDDLANIPAIKLLEFFRRLAQGDESIRRMGDASVTEALGVTNFSTIKMRQVSPTVARMKAIGEADADAWVKYWISKGGL